MWQAKLRLVERIGGSVKITITCTNGSEFVEKTEMLTSVPGDDFIKRRAAQMVSELESLDSWAKSLPLGLIDLTPDPVEPSKEGPTAEELAATSFFEKYRKLETMRLAVEKGLMKSDDAAISSLTAEVKAAWKPEYLDDDRMNSR